CGQANGIGAATARALAAAGISVAAAGHSKPSSLESLVDDIAKGIGAAFSLRGDVSSEADVARMVGEVRERWGRLDILVNNAGAPHGAERNEIEDVPLSAWEQVMAVNARGMFLMTRAAVPAMRQQKWGRIITVSSSA